jgi:hypothetical protein
MFGLSTTATVSEAIATDNHAAAIAFADRSITVYTATGSGQLHNMRCDAFDAAGWRGRETRRERRRSLRPGRMRPSARCRVETTN